MKTGLPQYVQAHTTRHGKTAYYYSRPGEFRIRLPDRSDPRFEAAIADAKENGGRSPGKNFDHRMSAVVAKKLSAAVDNARGRAKWAPLAG